MNYLTTLSIYHDGIDNIDLKPTKFSRELVDSILNKNNSGQTEEIGNTKVTIQKSRHKSEVITYIQKAGEVIEINPHSEHFWKKVNKNPEFFKDIINDFQNIVDTYNRLQKSMIKKSSS